MNTIEELKAKIAELEKQLALQTEMNQLMTRGVVRRGPVPETINIIKEVRNDNRKAA